MPSRAFAASNPKNEEEERAVQEMYCVLMPSRAFAASNTRQKERDLMTTDAEVLMPSRAFAASNRSGQRAHGAAPWAGSFNALAGVRCF